MKCRQKPGKEQMATTLCITQQKGGVAKTSTAIHLAAALARSGHRTLIIDLDQQAPVAPGLGVAPPEELLPIAEALLEQRVREIVLPTATERLFVAPGDVGLDSQALVNQPMRETVIQRALAGLRDEYDFILLDTPPNLDLVTLNAVFAADWLILPCDVDAESLRSLQRTLQVIGTYLQFRPEVDPALFYRVVITLYDPRRRVMNAWGEGQLEQLGGLLFHTRIHRAEVYPKARANGETVFSYAARHKTKLGSIARSITELEELTKEVLEHESQRRDPVECHPPGPAEAA